MQSRITGLSALQNHLILLERHVKFWDRRGRILFLHDEPDHAQFEVAASICISIVCLGELLNSLYKGLRSYPPALPGMIFEQKMKDSGYCPYVTARIEQICQPASCRHFISNMRPDNSTNHTNCCKNMCRNLMLHEESYMRRHIFGCDMRICQDICVEDFQIQAENDRPVSKILCAGEIPAVTVDHSAIPPKIHVHSIARQWESGQNTLTTRYVAISHVWSEYVQIPLMSMCTTECRIVV